MCRVVLASRKLEQSWTENVLQQRFLFSPESRGKKDRDTNGEVEAKNLGKRNSETAFREINQEFESQRFQSHQASRWADQAQRDKISFMENWF